VPRRRICVLVASVTFAGAPAPALGAMVSREGTAVVVRGTPAVDDVYVTTSPTTTAVEGATAGVGCTPALGGAECAMGGVAGVVVDLGAGDDRATAEVRGIPTILDGGAGADTLSMNANVTSALRGGPGDDQLAYQTDGQAGGGIDGGDGDDTFTGGSLGGAIGVMFTGGAGNDTFLLLDGLRDTVQCGPGADRTRVGDAHVLADGCAPHIADLRPAGTYTRAGALKLRLGRATRAGTLTLRVVTRPPKASKRPAVTVARFRGRVPAGALRPRLRLTAAGRAALRSRSSVLCTVSALMSDGGDRELDFGGTPARLRRTGPLKPRS